MVCAFWGVGVVRSLRHRPDGRPLARWLLEELAPGQELLAASRAVPEEMRRLPGQVQALVKTPENERALARLAPFTAECPIPKEGAVYYLCRDGACRPPVRDFTARRGAADRVYIVGSLYLAGEVKALLRRPSHD